MKNDECQIDFFAKDIAVSKYALPESVHIPVAAKEEADIIKYIGRITNVIVKGLPNKALLVEPYYIPQKDSLPIWQLPESEILHQSKQVWVHVNYKGYRPAYLKAFKDNNYKDLVMDHIMSRVVARLKFFNYLRIIPISKPANSSSAFSEKWAIKYHRSAKMKEVNKNSPARIQYADLADIVKMLNIKTGGSLQDPVNMAQALVRYPELGSAR